MWRNAVNSTRYAYVNSTAYVNNVNNDGAQVGETIFETIWLL